MNHSEASHIYIFSDILNIFECLENLQDNMEFMPVDIHVVPTVKRRGAEWHMSVSFQKEPLELYDNRQLQ